MRVVLADLKGRDGFVNKDTVVGGFGSRFRGISATMSILEILRKLYQNLPSIHVGYLAAIFAQAGHEVRVTNDEVAEGDRSEEHTSELQSLAYLVCRLLLEKKKKTILYTPPIAERGA